MPQFLIKICSLLNVSSVVLLSVCPSVCVSVKHVIVTKRKKFVPTFLYHIKDHSSYFPSRWGRPHVPEILGQTDPVGAKTPIFTVLHAMQTRSSDEKAVCPSVKRVNCDKTEERSVRIFIPYERSFSLVF